MRAMPLDPALITRGRIRKAEPHKVPGFATHHRGWTIWHWTGWKNNGKTVATADMLYEPGRDDEYRAYCRDCQQKIRVGDYIELQQCWDTYRHWDCAHPRGEPATVAGQWLATDGVRYCYASTSRGQGLYERGDMFTVGDELTEYSPQEELDAAQIDAFERLLRVIDEIEG
jgi:hypothetical protein